ncbi:MAG: ribulose 1,5-bisphosphate carboxylase, partial [Alphaproteobacteria bacterium]
FGYSTETCRRIATAARKPWDSVRAAVPVPAGGMSLDRVPEMLDFYGRDTMLLIGGALLLARENVTRATADFVARVRDHVHR